MTDTTALRPRSFCSLLVAPASRRSSKLPGCLAQASAPLLILPAPLLLAALVALSASWAEPIAGGQLVQVGAGEVAHVRAARPVAHEHLATEAAHRAEAAVAVISLVLLLRDEGVRRCEVDTLRPARLEAKPLLPLCLRLATAAAAAATLANARLKNQLCPVYRSHFATQPLARTLIEHLQLMAPPQPAAPLRRRHVLQEYPVLVVVLVGELEHQRLARKSDGPPLGHARLALVRRALR